MKRWRTALMERTVGHLVMAGRPGFGNSCQLRVGVDVAGAGAISQFTEVVRQALDGLLMRFGLEGVGVTAAASGTISCELPCRLIRIGRMTGRATRGAPVIARVLSRRMRKGHHRPVRVVMARGAVQRGRHVVGDFSGCSTTVVAALAVGYEAGVIEAGRGPRESSVACTAVLRCRYVIAR